MEKLVLEPGTHTPFISFDYDNAVMEMKGRSTPENSVEYYEPILEWLDNYKANPKGTTTVNVQFEYFNTSSSKCILDVMKRFVEIKNNGSEVIVNWYFEEDDEDMEEAGEDYSDILELPFNILPIEE